MQAPSACHLISISEQRWGGVLWSSEVVFMWNVRNEIALSPTPSELFRLAFNPFAFSCPLCSGFLSAFVSDVKAAPCKAPGLPLGALWTWSHRTEVIDHSFVKKQPHCHSESVPRCLQAAATFQGGFSGWWWPLKAQLALVSCWVTVSYLIHHFSQSMLSHNHLLWLFLFVFLSGFEPLNRLPQPSGGGRH